MLGRWVNDNTAGLRYERDPRMLVVRLEDLARPPYATLRRVLRHHRRVGEPRHFIIF